MAWNPSPKVAALRDFGEKFNKKIVLLIAFDGQAQFEIISYGRTKRLCDVAKGLADHLFNEMQKP